MTRTRANDARRDGWNAHVRGGWVMLWLWQGSRLTTRDVARLTGISIPAAHRMMVILSAAFPITRAEGLWQWIEREN